MTGEQVTIYALCDSAGGVKYIGQTRHVARRRAQHRKAWPALTMIVVTSTDEEHAEEVERRWIERYREQGCVLLNAKGYRPGGCRRRESEAVGPTVTVRVWLSHVEREQVRRMARRENRSLAGQLKQFIDEGLSMDTVPGEPPLDAGTPSPYPTAPQPEPGTGESDEDTEEGP